MLLPIDTYPILKSSFFARGTRKVARDLIGCALVRIIGESVLAGRIVETEAYHFSEPACHAFGLVDESGAPTQNSGRAVDLAAEPGTAYVYLNYGVHWLLNVTTEKAGLAAGVLIRAVEPLEITDRMRDNRPRAKRRIDLTNGPGKLTEAFEIDGSFHGSRLDRPPLYFSPANSFGSVSIGVSPRIGISKATELPWRYFLKGNPYVSR